MGESAVLNFESGVSYSVTLTAADPSSATDSISVEITVTDVNEAPEAVDDSGGTDEDTAVNIRVLTNDSDPENDDLTVSLRNRPRNGSASIEVDNTVTYTPSPNYHGADTFTYSVSDAGFSDEGAVSVTIRSVNDAPEFSSATAERSVSENAQPGANVGAPIAATDVDGDTLTYRLTGAAASDFEVEEHTGQITVSEGAVLATQTTYAATITADDQKGGAASIDVTITVTTRLIGPPIITSGGGGGGPSGPRPSLLDFEWNVKRDIEELDSGHDTPSGLWSDGVTLWLLQNGDGADDAIYAYDLESGERVEDREFDLDERNRAPRGVWSDRTTVWVSDSGQNRLFAHDLATGERLTDRDIALAGRNRGARGIWSSDGTMWVLDGGKDSIFAYDLESGELLAEYALDDANDEPHDLFFDGVTFWVSDDGEKRLFAYRIEAGEDGEDGLKRNRDEEFPNTVLSRASNNSPRGIWSDGDVMYVADASDDKVYSYNMPDAIDARLASLTLSGVDIGEFSPERPDYVAVVAEGVTETTIEAEAMQLRTSVAIKPDDSDGNETNGYQVALEGVTEITVTVTSADSSRRRAYRVAFELPVEEIELTPTWTSFQWPGPDGVPVADALRDGGFSDTVIVIYHWDEDSRTWSAFFPGLEDIPGINTLTALQQGSTYWIAVTEPVTWTLATADGALPAEA